MPYIPKDTKCYIADLVVEITVENEPGNIVHVNTVLIRADSPEEAYKISIEVGEKENDTYENPKGNKVICKFRGLRDLKVVHEELEHGAELFFEEQVDIEEEKVKKQIRPKEKLGIFAPIEKANKPNYIDKEIYDAAIKAGFKKDELK